jgi:integrase
VNSPARRSSASSKVCHRKSRLLSGRIPTRVFPKIGSSDTSKQKKLRSQKEIERILNKYVFPHWGSRDFVGIRRSDIAGLLDLIEDGHGATQADATLAVIRGISNWYSKRHDEYVSPFVRGMKRAGTKSRNRTLDDGELRSVWKQAEGEGTFGAFVRMLLLTAQRRSAVLRMRWSDISDDGVWTIPKEDRAKGNAGSLRLPQQALAIIKALPQIAGNPYLFAGRGDGPINGISKAKVKFDKRCKVAGWTLHDCRRTSRSILSRAGVRPDISERLMGHALPGVEGIYDRFSYAHEKADALKRLATLINEIVSGEPSGKVVKLSKARADA